MSSISPVRTAYTACADSAHAGEEVHRFQRRSLRSPAPLMGYAHFTVIGWGWGEPS